MEAWKRRSKWLTLCTLTLVYVVGELTHFLLGIVTRPMSQDIHYGKVECLTNTDVDVQNSTEIHCYTANNHESCLAIGYLPNVNESACVWDYSGLGLQYQILAGPCFIAVFTVSGVILGMAADRYSRYVLLCLCFFLVVTCTTLTGAARYYWHLVILRMGIGAGESVISPASSSIISDLFSSDRLGLALGIFNCGIYLGYGLSYAVGNFVTNADILGMGWRWSYYISGCFGAAVFILLLLLVREPKRKSILTPQTKTEDETIRHDVTNAKGQNSMASGLLEGPNVLPRKENRWREVLKSFKQRAVIILTIAACIRHTGGFTWAYNTQPFYNTYYPDYSLGIWITIISIVGGTLGVALGGFTSDRMMAKGGLKSRIYVLSGSQLLATPLAVGVLYLKPPVSFYMLLATYFFAEMWFGILYAILLELIPKNGQTTTIAVFVFIISNVGGNAPILVEPLRDALSYRLALLIMFPGFYFLSSVIFLSTLFFIQ